MSDTHLDYQTSGINNQTAQEQQEFNLFAMLKPSIQKDGNQWCVLYGENLQVGLAGFGKSPHLAIMDFNNQWYKEIEAKPLVANITPDMINNHKKGDKR